jgi:hypothetical protein
MFVGKHVLHHGSWITIARKGRNRTDIGQKTDVDHVDGAGGFAGPKAASIARIAFKI